MLRSQNCYPLDMQHILHLSQSDSLFFSFYDNSPPRATLSDSCRGISTEVLISRKCLSFGSFFCAFDNSNQVISNFEGIELIWFLWIWRVEAKHWLGQPVWQVQSKWKTVHSIHDHIFPLGIVLQDVSLVDNWVDFADCLHCPCNLAGLIRHIYTCLFFPVESKWNLFDILDHILGIEVHSTV